MKRHKFLALTLIGALGLGLVGCGGGGEEAASVTAETSAEPVHITTTESWDFSSGFYPAVAPGSTGSGYDFVYYIRNCYDTLVTRDPKAIISRRWLKAGISQRTVLPTPSICVRV